MKEKNKVSTKEIILATTFVGAIALPYILMLITDYQKYADPFIMGAGH